MDESLNVLLKRVYVGIVGMASGVTNEGLVKGKAEIK